MNSRHSRHEAFPPIGPEGQERIYAARVGVIGCGALGTHAAEMLARAGVGRSGVLRIIDRDYVDLSNLQRQTLFIEADARESRPKAVAAVSHLLEIDSLGSYEAVVRDFNASNARSFTHDLDLVVDATDNFRSRFVINDAAVAEKKPWIYGGAVGSQGMVAMIVPDSTPCLRCFLEVLPPLGSYDSCDTAGIITPLPAAVAALQVSYALRWIVGERDLPRGLTKLDLWRGSQSRQLESAERDPNCPSCGTGELPALRAQHDELVVLCGRNSIQLFTESQPDLVAAAQQMERAGRALRRNRESITAEIDEGLLTLFYDGRVIVEGTTDPLQARSIVARYLGG
jgi:adenylyltransferase/sulfurtransferase